MRHFTHTLVLVLKQDYLPIVFGSVKMYIRS